MPNNFDVFEWLKFYFNRTEMFDGNEIKAISDFSILWNLFENKLCKTNANASCFSKIAKDYANRQTLNAVINSTLNYFKKRYVRKDNNFTDLFGGLNFRPADNKKLVENVLLNDNPKSSSKIECLLTIIYRFRCNLFHGEKDIETIHLQNVNFEIINQFLVKLLEENKRKNAT